MQWPHAIFLKACHHEPITAPILTTATIAILLGLPAAQCAPNDDEKDEITGIELLYSMPAPSPWAVQQGINDLTIGLEPTLGAMEDARLRLHHSGLLVLSAGLQASLPGLYAEAMARVQWAERCLQAGGIDVGKAAFRYLEMSSRQEQRFDLLFEPSNIAIGEFVRSAPWQPLIEHILGPLTALQHRSMILT